jgi:hypothetical protein
MWGMRQDIVNQILIIAAGYQTNGSVTGCNIPPVWV